MLIKTRKLSFVDSSNGRGTLRDFICIAKRHRILFYAGCPDQSRSEQLGKNAEIYYEYELDVTRDMLLKLLEGDEALDEVIPEATDEFIPSHGSFSAGLDWAEGLGVGILFKS